MLADKPEVANQSVLESLKHELIAIDGAQQICDVSTGLCQLVGTPAAELLGRQVEECQALTAWLTDEPTVTFVDAHGTHYQFSHSRQRLPGSKTGSLHLYTNISCVHDLLHDNQRLTEEARQLQLIDPDTSLLTQRAFLLLFDSQVARCRRYHTPLTLIRICIDSVAITGDVRRRIMRLGRLLRDQLRWSDLIAHPSTSEFYVLLPETDADAAMLLINKLRSSVEQWQQPLSLRFTMTAWKRGQSASDMMQACDQDITEPSQQPSRRLSY